MEPSALPLGVQVGAWRVLGRGGHGSYGMVYRVERVGDEGAGTFALKLSLRPMDPRFEREAELLSRLTHAHVPRLFDQGTWESPEGVSFPYLVMEWVEGVPLYEWAERHPVSSRQVLGLLAQVASALAATHAAGGVHRDVKGDNVLVCADGTKAVLMDFGSGSYAGAKRLTWRPEPPGTFQYWSIEALRFRWRFRYDDSAHYEAGPTDDVYALGVMAYRLVTGKYPPSLEPKALDMEDGYVRSKRIAPERLARVSPKLAAFIRRMLSEAPLARGNAEEVAQALVSAAMDVGRQASNVITRHSKQAAPVKEGRFGGWGTGATWLGGLTVAVVSALWWEEGEWAKPAKGGKELVKIAQPARQHHAEDGGTAGLGDAVSDSSRGGILPKVEQGGIGFDMPKKPFPGQHRPPCAKPEIKINEGCWIALAEELPPCGAHAYEWKGKCYRPTFDPPPPSTSSPR
ncbi:serine/threonine-protein kinase [Stigmatella hybrida]|uniref:serine/threonine-protein kinase n=1 Tax=Stigmatella hybrida TaxID=394097 RepID=UPI001CDABBBE|nr:serine/threonine-protein kinase [Stigmatella hybrida]